MPCVGTRSAGGQARCSPWRWPAVLPMAGRSWGCAHGLGGAPVPPGGSMHSPFAAGPRGSMCLGFGAPCWGLCLWGQAWGSVGTARCFRAQSPACQPPPTSRARGLGTHNGAVCARVCSGFAARGNVVFSRRRGQRGWVCEGRQGRAGTQPRSVPGHGSTRRCSPARADASPLAPGPSQALPGPRWHRGCAWAGHHGLWSLGRRLEAERG